LPDKKLPDLYLLE